MIDQANLLLFANFPTKHKENIFVRKGCYFFGIGIHGFGCQFLCLSFIYL